ncbi:MAG: 3-hydroxyacyl-CoA dehydrogenase NAD-binding domain-containing protein, partial [Gemmatimonadota bacterium]|nr:3-hydroxyacyl-CoA dehydrogenase NAD-binding domain-containing protein [Gemmatimonadota bacterium]
MIERVAVLGSGTMGHGIAQVCAAAGWDVALYDVNDDAVSRGLGLIRGNLEKGMERGKVTEEERDAVLSHLAATTSIADAVRAADLVIEAAPEVMQIKRALFTEVDDSAPARAIIATNTSSLSIAAMADTLREPGRFVGLHFFNPVHIMALVEVVWGPATTDATLDAAVDFVRRLGKE